MTIQTSSGQAQLTATSCSCGFSSTHLLPCRHIFAMRKKQGLDPYTEELVAKDGCLTKRKYIAAVGTTSCDSVPLTSVLPKPVALSQQQKYKLAFTQTQKLAEFACEVSTPKFKQRLAVLKKVVSFCEQQRDASVVDISEEVSHGDT